MDTDSPGDDDRAVQDALGIFIGDPYPNNDSVVVSVSCRQISTKFHWEVTVNYDQSPLAKSGVWHVTFQDTKVPVKLDLDGKKVQNKAGDPFLPTLEMDKSIIKMTYDINKPNFNLRTALNYWNKVNDAEWLGFPKWSVKLDNVDAQQFADFGSSSYWRLVYNFTVKMVYIPFYGDEGDDDPLGWVGEYNPIRVLNEGFYYLKDGKKTPIYENGVIKTTPSLLTDTGGILAADGRPTYVNFKFYDEANFGSLLDIGE